jgi:hypothetical protein
MQPDKPTDRIFDQVGPDTVTSLLATTDTEVHLNQDSACKVLKHYFDDLELSLTHEDKNHNIGQSETILTGISQFIQSDKNQILSDGYTRLLNRLTEIYTRGLAQHANQAFAATAANYAGVIETVSQAHPSYDYSEAIGHLLHYMNQLYRDREKSWRRIFEHLLSMPDSIQLVQSLKEHHLKGIQQWVEEGVDNLFQLRDDQIQLHAAKITQLTDAEQAVEAKHLELQSGYNAKIVPLSRAIDMAALKSLIHERNLLIEELENRQDLVDLLDQNIQEFEDKLFAPWRAYLIQLVRT